MEPFVEVIVNVVTPLVLLVIGYFFGHIAETNHFKSIRMRELRHRQFPAITNEGIPDTWNVEAAHLVTGHVVVSVDYFKRFLAWLRSLFGGEIAAYESIMDRGRREAVLRMKEIAIKQGYNAVINVRLESSRLASSNRQGKGTAGIEILAFGTAIKYNEVQHELPAPTP